MVGLRWVGPVLRRSSYCVNRRMLVGRGDIGLMQRDRVSIYTITPVQTKHTASLAAGSIDVSESE